jgi:Tol biopolymer transport system component
MIDIGNTIMGGGGGGPVDATLYDTLSGQVTPATGIPGGALMPMFSPDGTLLVFNDYALNQAHGLAIMGYDVKTHTATPMKTLVEETSATRVRAAELSAAAGSSS